MVSTEGNLNPNWVHFNEINSLRYAASFFLQRPNFFGCTGQKIMTGTGNSDYGESVTTTAAQSKQSTRHERGNT